MAQPMLCAAIKISIHALREEGDNVRIQTENYP